MSNEDRGKYPNKRECWACGATTTSTRIFKADPRIRLHKFPTTVERCSEWIDKSGCEELRALNTGKYLNMHAVFCNKHFEPSCYLNPLGRLTSYAVPTLFGEHTRPVESLPYPLHLFPCKEVEPEAIVTQPTSEEERSCCVPGCERSVKKWRQARQCDKPMLFSPQSHAIREVWEQRIEHFSTRLNQLADLPSICEIHFSREAFSSPGTLRAGATPTLYLDKLQNLRARAKYGDSVRWWSKITVAKKSTSSSLVCDYVVNEDLSVACTPQTYKIDQNNFVQKVVPVIDITAEPLRDVNSASEVPEIVNIDCDDSVSKLQTMCSENTNFTPQRLTVDSDNTSFTPQGLVMDSEITSFVPQEFTPEPVPSSNANFADIAPLCNLVVSLDNTTGTFSILDAPVVDTTQTGVLQSQAEENTKIDITGSSFLFDIPPPKEESGNKRPVNIEPLDAITLPPPAVKKPRIIKSADRKKQFLRTLCTSPIELPSTKWAVHSDPSDNTVWICEMSCKRGKISIEKSVVLTLDINHPKIRVHGSEVKLLSKLKLKEIRDVEDLIAKVDQLQ